MNNSRLFGKLLDEGISSVSKRQGKTIAAVESEIAEQVGYSQHTVQYWKRGNIPPQGEHILFLVRYCAQNGRVDRSWAQSLLTQAQFAAPDGFLDELFGAMVAASKHVFLCYQRGIEPDNTIALHVAQALSQRYDVFFDQSATADPSWFKRIERQLVETDAMVLFLSDEAAHNELILSQIDRVHTQMRSTPPALLPVRLPYRQPLPLPLKQYLEPVEWTQWQGEHDTERVIKELEKAIEGSTLPLDFRALPTELRLPATPDVSLSAPFPAAQTIVLEMPEGTMSADSRYYVERTADQIALTAIRGPAHTHSPSQGQGVTITIKGPRQVGKSSLLIRICDVASQAGKRVAFLDFQLLNAVLTDPDTFFRQFCTLLSYQLRLPDQTEEYWNTSLPNPFRCTEYLARHIVPSLQQPVVLAMDEVDSVFDTSFRTDFFGMLRSWHNSRAIDAGWRRVDLALVTSTEPYYFIDNLNQSPFNVGEVIELSPFTAAQVEDLNQRHGAPLSGTDSSRLAELVNGHPYLVRRALYLVASERYSASDIFERAMDEDGPFSDHLRSLLTRLYSKTELVQGLREILRSGTCSNEVFFRLRGAGVVRRRQNQVIPSSPLYAGFLRGHVSESTT